MLKKTTVISSNHSIIPPYECETDPISWSNALVEDDPGEVLYDALVTYEKQLNDFVEDADKDTLDATLSNYAYGQRVICEELKKLYYAQQHLINAGKLPGGWEPPTKR